MQSSRKEQCYISIGFLSPRVSLGPAIQWALDENSLNELMNERITIMGVCRKLSFPGRIPTSVLTDLVKGPWHDPRLADEEVEAGGERISGLR